MLVIVYKLIMIYFVELIIFIIWYFEKKMSKYKNFEFTFVNLMGIWYILYINEFFWYRLG